MDEFANEYFNKITKISTDFTSRRKELAKSRIKMFIGALCRQLIDFKENYDLLLGSGNSGLFMTKIALMTYESLNVTAPSVLNLPIYRFKEDGAKLHDNSFLETYVKEQLKSISSINNILFVDDEIMRGLTAKECFSLILKAFPNINHLDATIIAENHFFEWHYKMPKISISFFAYSPLIQGLNGNIGYFIPQNLFNGIQKIIPEIKSYNQAMAIVINGGIKKIVNNKGEFDLETEKDLKTNLPNYKKTKNELLEEIQILVKKSVKEYKEEKIKFRF
ncbi:MAG: hypothetical protein A3D74_02700 [Candidatus Levybacteria bacterium RIFCSPHIGHO2_02_FULL_37_13]|nr:MAG: hypothetical protein A3D74_02700 [Candidatus Levybacteria bacterium RIFCSPHIGHO2_02_FULL_37_13]OGH37614.1 MAG: hypothetical protein A3B41_02090 [Candidatus Levybacteria bacterium RIFCSPLOWO2_01_FULL_37_26]